MLKQKIKRIKDSLKEVIHQTNDRKQDFVKSPKSDFTRNRKMGFEDIIYFIINMGGKVLSQELLDHTTYSLSTISKSTFVQRRDKIKPEAF